MSNELKKKGRRKKTVETEKNVEVSPIKNKRGRKNKIIHFQENMELKDDNPIVEENIILCLPITLDQVNKSENEYEYDEGDKKENTREELLLEKPSKNKNMNVYNYGADMIEIYQNIDFLNNRIDYNNLKSIKFAKTDILCWWCCYNFDTYPISYPINYNINTNTYKVIGCFCSFNCAKSYGRYEYNNKNLLKSYYKTLLGMSSNIKYAPPKYVLEKFGGPITIEQYRDSFNTLDKIQMNILPFSYIPIQIEYHKINKSIKSNDSNNSYLSKQINNIYNKKIENTNNKNKNKNENEKKNSKSNDILNIMGITYE